MDVFLITFVLGGQNLEMTERILRLSYSDVRVAYTSKESFSVETLSFITTVMVSFQNKSCKVEREELE